MLFGHRKGARGKEDETSSYSCPSYHVVFLLAASTHISIMGEVVENQDVPRQQQAAEDNAWRLDINKYKPTRPAASQNPKAHGGCLNQRFGKSCYIHAELFICCFHNNVVPNQYLSII